MTALKFIPQDTAYVPLPGSDELVALSAPSELVFDPSASTITFEHEGSEITLFAEISARGRLIVYRKDWTSIYVENLTLNLGSCVGRTVRSAKIKNANALYLTFTDGLNVVLRHERNCCEQVDILDQWGDVEDIVGGQVVTFEARTRGYKPSKRSRGKTPRAEKNYTFYEVRTTRGDLTLRWGHTNDNTHYGEEITASVI
jgi:hypothetical protein